MREDRTSASAHSPDFQHDCLLPSTRERIKNHLSHLPTVFLQHSLIPLHPPPASPHFSPLKVLKENPPSVSTYVSFFKTPLVKCKVLIPGKGSRGGVQSRKSEVGSCTDTNVPGPLDVYSEEMKYLISQKKKKIAGNMNQVSLSLSSPAEIKQLLHTTSSSVEDANGVPDALFI